MGVSEVSVLMRIIRTLSSLTERSGAGGCRPLNVGETKTLRSDYRTPLRNWAKNSNESVLPAEGYSFRSATELGGRSVRPTSEPPPISPTELCGGTFCRRGFNVWLGLATSRWSGVATPTLVCSGTAPCGRGISLPSAVRPKAHAEARVRNIRRIDQDAPLAGRERVPEILLSQMVMPWLSVSTALYGLG